MTPKDAAIELAKQLISDPAVQNRLQDLGKTVAISGTGYVLQNVSGNVAAHAIAIKAAAVGKAAVVVIMSPPGLACLCIIAIGGIAYALSENEPTQNTLFDCEADHSPMVDFIDRQIHDTSWM